MVESAEINNKRPDKTVEGGNQENDIDSLHVGFHAKQVWD